MLSDLAALTPPLIVGAAFVIGVVLFMRRQLGPAAGTDDDDGRSHIPVEPRNADPGGQPPGPPAGQRKV
jgi:hypothetical protein